MRKPLKIISILILWFFILPSLLYAFEGKVVGISDGDTIKAIKNGRMVKIRLAAIDCPEKGQPYGQKAKRFTSDLVAGKVVVVREIGTDKYGRIIGFVIIGDKNLNKKLLSAGLAWHYKRYSHDPELAKIESEARSSKIGLWSEPNPIPPWQWRRQKRSKKY